MIRRPPRSTQSRSSAASDVYKRQSLHPSTIICPITTNVVKESDILRVHIKKGISNMQQPSDLMIDQIRAIDNKRFDQKIGEIPADLRKRVTENLKIVLDLE